MSTCPTCKKPNCGNWAACARRGEQNEVDVGDLLLVYTARVVRFGIGVAEAMFQTGLRAKDPLFLLTLGMEGSESVRKGLFIAAIRHLDRRAREEER